MPDTSPDTIDIGSLTAPTAAAAPVAASAAPAQASPSPDTIDIGSLTAPPPTPQTKSSALGAAAKGAFDGFTFGLGPKATNAIGLTSKDDFDTAHAEHPIAYNVGEIGGILPSLLIPGAGEANVARAGVTAAIKTAAKAADEAPKAVRAIEAAFKPAMSAAKAVDTVLPAAAAGAASGVGHSDSIADIPSEALKGAAFGAAIPGLAGHGAEKMLGLVGAVPGLGALTEMAKRIPKQFERPQVGQTLGAFLPSTFTHGSD